MSRETLKNLIELVPESDIDVLYKVIIKFIPEVEPEPDELAALLEQFLIMTLIGICKI